MSAYQGVVDYEDLLNMQDECILESLEEQELEELLESGVKWPTDEEEEEDSNYEVNVAEDIRQENILRSKNYGIS